MNQKIIVLLLLLLLPCSFATDYGEEKTRFNNAIDSFKSMVELEEIVQGEQVLPVESMIFSRLESLKKNYSEMISAIESKNSILAKQKHELVSKELLEISEKTNLGLSPIGISRTIGSWFFADVQEIESNENPEFQYSVTDTATGETTSARNESKISEGSEEGQGENNAGEGSIVEVGSEQGDLSAVLFALGFIAVALLLAGAFIKFKKTGFAFSILLSLMLCILLVPGASADEAVCGKFNFLEYCWSNISPTHPQYSSLQDCSRGPGKIISKLEETGVVNYSTQSQLNFKIPEQSIMGVYLTVENCGSYTISNSTIRVYNSERYFTKNNGSKTHWIHLQPPPLAPGESFSGSVFYPAEDFPEHQKGGSTYAKVMFDRSWNHNFDNPQSERIVPFYENIESGSGGWARVSGSFSMDPSNIYEVGEEICYSTTYSYLTGSVPRVWVSSVTNPGFYDSVHRGIDFCNEGFDILVGARVNQMCSKGGLDRFIDFFALDLIESKTFGLPYGSDNKRCLYPLWPGNFTWNDGINICYSGEGIDCFTPNTWPPGSSFYAQPEAELIKGPMPIISHVFPELYFTGLGTPLKIEATIRNDFSDRDLGEGTMYPLKLEVHFFRGNSSTPNYERSYSIESLIPAGEKFTVEISDPGYDISNVFGTTKIRSFVKYDLDSVPNNWNSLLSKELLYLEESQTGFAHQAFSAINTSYEFPALIELVFADDEDFLISPGESREIEILLKNPFESEKTYLLSSNSSLTRFVDSSGNEISEVIIPGYSVIGSLIEPGELTGITAIVKIPSTASNGNNSISLVSTQLENSSVSQALQVNARVEKAMFGFDAFCNNCPLSSGDDAIVHVPVWNPYSLPAGFNGRLYYRESGREEVLVKNFSGSVANVSKYSPVIIGRNNELAINSSIVGNGGTGHVVISSGGVTYEKYFAVSVGPGSISVPDINLLGIVIVGLLALFIVLRQHSEE